jgi:hypothetical protein
MFVQDLARATEDFFANGGDLGSGPTALKQDHTQIGLNLGQLRRQAGLADVEL